MPVFYVLLVRRLDHRRQAAFGLGGRFGKSLNCILLPGGSTSQWNLLKEEDSYRTDNHNRHAQDEDVVYTLCQANFHGLDDLIEYLHLTWPLSSCLGEHLRLHIRIEQDLW